ncbi:MAG: Hsp20/alpha crystallin family protein [Candidatus Aminicenantes bacterium]|nr:Hsp20/alpha crystallin family protein [Candidatus Aminicenantes bacterium]
MSPVKRIKPVARSRKVRGEIRRQVEAAGAGRPEILELDGGWTPRLDLSVRGPDIVVEMEAPGLGPADLQVLLQPGRLTIKGIKRQDAPPARYTCLRLEREYGAFRRSLALPAAVVPDEAQAFLENGLLTIVMPKLRDRRSGDP